jgi:WD40 repeat protein
LISTGRRCGSEQPRLPSGIGALVFSPDGRRLLVTSHDNGELIAWDMGTRRKLASARGHLAQVHSLARAANGSELVSEASEGWRRWRLDEHFCPVHTRSFDDA